MRRRSFLRAIPLAVACGLLAIGASAVLAGVSSAEPPHGGTMPPAAHMSECAAMHQGRECPALAPGTAIDGSVVSGDATAAHGSVASGCSAAHDESTASGGSPCPAAGPGVEHLAASSPAQPISGRPAFAG